MVACYKPRVICSTAGCTKAALYFCRYPVTRRGRTEQCRRPLCQRCSNDDRHCPPHSRIAGESLVKICSACFTASCPSGEMVCAAPGPARLVTRAQYLTNLSFGLL